MVLRHAGPCRNAHALWRTTHTALLAGPGRPAEVVVLCIACHPHAAVGEMHAGANRAKLCTRPFRGAPYACRFCVAPYVCPFCVALHVRGRQSVRHHAIKRCSWGRTWVLVLGSVAPHVRGRQSARPCSGQLHVPLLHNPFCTASEGIVRPVSIGVRLPLFPSECASHWGPGAMPAQTARSCRHSDRPKSSG